MNLSDLPEIHIVRHARATRLRLRVVPHEIRLTAPVLCTQKQIQLFITQSTPWLIETWQGLQLKVAGQDRTLPLQLKLFNLDQPLQIQYQKQKQTAIFDAQSQQLTISDRAPEQYLKAFVIGYAKHYLPLYLDQVSQDCALKFASCNIRHPKTRWGSCSSRHDIMLNAALVLFPLEITRYVCVHELAHTQHFDHSAQFWAEVYKHDIDFQQHRKTLKSTPLPYWWHQGQ